MKTQMRSPALLLSLAVLLLAGCADNNPLESESSVDPEQELLASVPPGSHDAYLVQLAQDVPGFGGLFYDESGRLNVYLLQDEDEGAGKLSLEARRDEVQAALTARLGPDVLARGSLGRNRSAGSQGLQSEVQVLAGQYDILELAQWRMKMTSVLSVPGVVLTDLAEGKNRLRIGLEPGASASQVESELSKLGIPREAVLIEEVAPVKFAKSLRDRFRPVVGGVQISFGNFICTLGFNAVRSGVRGFVTNSHCTNVQGGNETTVFYQFGGSSTNRIGIEQHDPQYFIPNCPAGRRCRWSDTAFAKYDSGVTSGLGKIARVTGVGTPGYGNAGSITIDSSRPTYTIVSETLIPTTGEVLDKIGRTTGHTFGTVGSTCVNTNVSGTNITQLCQDFVEGAGVGPGDSGSPVFRWASSGNISLYGILWGDSGSGFVFSAMANIESSSEMGALKTF